MWIHQHVDIVAAKILPIVRKSIRYMLVTPADCEVRAVGYADIAFVFDVDVMPGDWVNEPSEVAAIATTIGQCLVY